MACGNRVFPSGSGRRSGALLWERTESDLEDGQAFMPIMYNNFRLPIEESLPPTDREETLDETPLEEELRLIHEVEEDEEMWRTR